MAEPLEELIGGKYEILQKIKEGGMGSIYRVRHRLLEEERVVKVLRPQYALDDEFRARFQNEARAAIRLRHPNIAHIYDFSVDDRGNSYIVMEYIAGVTLQQLVANSGPPSLGLSIEIARQALDAIGYLHRQGFVHRDIASDNLMLTTDFEDSPLVKLIDLGIAKAQETDVNLTATGVFMGKARYSPPEQFAGSGGASSLDRRSDIYSFGVMFYELLTGRFPVEGQDFSQIVAGHLFREPLEFSASDPEGRIPEALRGVVLRTLAKEPDDRVQSIEELLELLEPFREPIAAKKREFTRALSTTSSRLAQTDEATRPGSTQSRLDGQFPAHGASAVHGGSPAPQAAPRPAAEPDGRSTVHETARPAIGRPRALWIGLAAVLATAAVAGWVLTRTSPAGSAAAPSGKTLALEPVARWSPAIVEIESGEWSAWDDPSLGEPPPFDENDAEAAPPPAPAPPPVVVRAAPPELEPTETPPRQQPAQEPEPAGAEPRAAADDTTARREPRRSAGELLEGTPGVVPPVLLALPKPVPPDGAREREKEIVIIVAVLVDESGQVVDSRIEKGPRFKLKYRELALETARRARFRPASRNGLPGRMWTQVRVVFHPE